MPRTKSQAAARVREATKRRESAEAQAAAPTPHITAREIRDRRAAAVERAAAELAEQVQRGRQVERVIAGAEALRLVGALQDVRGDLEALSRRQSAVLATRGRLVEQARAAGATWAQITEATGVTRHALLDAEKRSNR